MHPALASFATFQLPWVWNDLLVALLAVSLALQGFFVRGVIAGSGKG